MAQENIEKVVELIRSNPDLQARLAAATDPAEYKATALAIAEENGLPITGEEFDAALAAAAPEGQQLTTDELAGIAGGAGAISITCSTYHECKLRTGK